MQIALASKYGNKFLFSTQYARINKYSTSLMSSRRPSKRDGPPDWGLVEGLTNPHRKKKSCYEMLHTRTNGLLFWTW